MVAKKSEIADIYEENKHLPREEIEKICLKKTGLSKVWVQEKVRGLIAKDTGIPARKVSPVGLSEKEFRGKFDALYKIRQGVQQLEQDRFLTDAEFREMISLDPTSFKHKTQATEFEKYRGIVKQTVYWSHPESIKRLKEEGVLK